MATLYRSIQILPDQVTPLKSDKDLGPEKNLIIGILSECREYAIHDGARPVIFWCIRWFLGSSLTFPKEQVMAEKWWHIFSRLFKTGYPGKRRYQNAGNHIGRIYPCSLFQISLSQTADPVFLKPAVTKNHDPDLFASGKCPHTVIIDFLHVPELIPGKVILHKCKK